MAVAAEVAGGERGRGGPGQRSCVREPGLEGGRHVVVAPEQVLLVSERGGAKVAVANDLNTLGPLVLRDGVGP